MCKIFLSLKDDKSGVPIGFYNKARKFMRWCVLASLIQISRINQWKKKDFFDLDQYSSVFFQDQLGTPQKFLPNNRSCLALFILRNTPTQKKRQENSLAKIDKWNMIKKKKRLKSMLTIKSYFSASLSHREISSSIYQARKTTVTHILVLRKKSYLLEVGKLYELNGGFRVLELHCLAKPCLGMGGWQTDNCFQCSGSHWLGLF